MNTRIRNVPTIEDLQNLVTETLVYADFSEFIPLTKNLRDLSNVRKFYLGTLFFLPVILTGSVLWIPILLAGLVGEQIVYWLKNKDSSLNDLFSRSVYQRVNITFYIIYTVGFAALITLSPHSWTFVLAMYVLQSMVLYELHESFHYPKRSRSVISAGKALKRAVRQFLAILAKGTSLVAPGLIITFVLSLISQEIWQPVILIGWVRITLISVVLLLLVILAVKGLVRDNIRRGIIEIVKTGHAPSANQLFGAIVRHGPRGRYYEFERQMSEQYERATAWKWLQEISRRAIQGVADELARQARWRLLFASLLVFPLIFGFILAFTMITFPSSVLSTWSPPSPSDPGHPVSILAFADWQQIQVWAERIAAMRLADFFADPLVKFATLSSIILVAQFIIINVRDSSRLLASIEADDETIHDWYTLVFAYFALKEQNHQVVGRFSVQIGGLIDLTWLLPVVVMIPSDATQATAHKIIWRVREEMKEERGLTIPCLVLAPRNVFAQSRFAKFLRADLQEFPDEEGKTDRKQTTTCWVWMNVPPYIHRTVQFTNLDSAEDWIRLYLKTQYRGRRRIPGL